MHRLTAAGFSLVLLASILSMPSSAALNESPAVDVKPRPTIELEPQDVVRIVIDALSSNDRPYADAGIETTFAFASPANRANTGPLEKFARMVKGPPYGIMVDHARSEFSEVVLAGNKAYQMVHLTASDGRAMVFAFRLSKQLDGEFRNMWMTDAVWPVVNAAIPEQVF